MPEDFSWLTKPLPVIWINVNGAKVAGAGLPDAMRTPGTAKVIADHDGTPVTSIDGKPVVIDSPILLSLRGSSSTNFAQQPYALKFVNAAKMNVDYALLGMPADNSWALISCYSDKTCLRNALTYALGQEIAKTGGRWAPRFRWAEVYLDGAYQGVYQVVQKVDGGKDSVNLPKPPMAAGSESAGGYMISADGDGRSIRSWNMFNPMDEFLDRRARAVVMMAPDGFPKVPYPAELRNHRRWKFRSPDPEDMTAAQRMYVQTAFDSMNMALESGAPNWRDLIDIASFVDYALISEFSNNVDAYFKSFYLYKQPDMGMTPGKWSMWPIWDFDIAYGNSDYYFRYCATTSTMTEPVPPPTMSQYDLAPPPFADAVFKDTMFRNQLRCRWHDLRKAGGVLDIAQIEQRIDRFVAHLATAKERERTSAKWKDPKMPTMMVPTNIGRYIWPNNYIGATLADEIRYLKYWIRKRVAWMDTSLPGTCTATPRPPAVTQMTAPPSVKVDAATRTAPWGAEDFRHPDFVPIEGAITAPAAWACPAR